MFLTMNQICNWVGTNPAERKFIEGERVLKAGHIIKCGKNINNDLQVSFTALCLQTTNIRLAPHEIKGVVNSEEIITCTCTCKAGLGEKCKHIVAALLYCYQYSNNLDTLSCTDKECEWKKKQKKILENYDPVPLLQHECFSSQPPKKIAIVKNALKELQTESREVTKEKKVDETNVKILISKKKMNETEKNSLSEADTKTILKIICNDLPNSALSKHMLGRHEAVTLKRESIENSIEEQVIAMIFQRQDSKLMNDINRLFICDIQDCCADVIHKLSTNIEEICIQSKDWYAYWLKERKFRITGSTCYGLFTYTNNKNADWDKKCDDFLKPKQFKTEFTEYGKNTEQEARTVFANANKFQIIEIGLVISKLNPWLAYSPDGIIMDGKDAVALLEIKCPFVGKTDTIDRVIDSQLKGCLKKEGENIVLKKKHRYYGQIQLGMAVLNLPFTYFVIYSKCDRKFLTLKVAKDESFISSMLIKLKNIYYKFMLHKICLLELQLDKNSHCMTK